MCADFVIKPTPFLSTQANTRFGSTLFYAMRHQSKRWAGRNETGLLSKSHCPSWFSQSFVHIFRHIITRARLSTDHD
jgi:hypothetical protein